MGSIPLGEFWAGDALFPDQEEAGVAFILDDSDFDLLLPDAIGAVPDTIVLALVALPFVEREPL